MVRLDLLITVLPNRDNSTKSNGGTKGQWDKGTFVFSIFSIRTKTAY